MLTFWMRIVIYYIRDGNVRPLSRWISYFTGDRRDAEPILHCKMSTDADGQDGSEQHSRQIIQTPVGNLQVDDKFLIYYAVVVVILMHTAMFVPGVRSRLLQGCNFWILFIYSTSKFIWDNLSGSFSVKVFSELNNNFLCYDDYFLVGYASSMT